MVKTTMSEAIKEARTVAYSDDPVIQTLEIYSQGQSIQPIFIVNARDSITAKLEDKKGLQTFLPASFKIKEPSQGVSQVPQIDISIVNVNGLISGELDKLMGTSAKVEVIYRVYTKKTLSLGPQITPPPRYEVVRVGGFEDLSIVVRPLNLAKIAFPKETHDKLY